MTIRKIILTLREEDASKLESLGLDESDVGLLLRDALGEFDRAREPVSNYVEDRYPVSEYSESFRSRKFAEVISRKDLAEVLRRTQVTFIDEFAERSYTERLRDFIWRLNQQADKYGLPAEMVREMRALYFGTLNLRHRE